MVDEFLECKCVCGCEAYAGEYSWCVDCLEGTHQNNNKLDDGELGKE